MTLKEADGKTPNLCKDDENCQSCVLVYEARRRGINITALPYMGKGTIAYKLGEDIALAFRNEKGKNVHATKIKGNEAKIKADLKKKLSEIGRYHIGVNYNNGWGHVVVAERIDNKTIIIYDPQKSEYMSVASLTAEVSYLDFLRVDNLLIDYKTLKGVSRTIP